MSDGEANLVEVFSSVQGEGTYVGASTLFVRFGECDLRCRWCDTPHSWQRATECRIETSRGGGTVRRVPNPVRLEDVAAAAEVLEVARHAFVRLTGGEPLLQSGAVAWLARRLRARGPRIHLETHGLHAERLAEVLDAVDVVAMDWKLASDVRRATDPRSGPVRDFHAAHEEFLRVAREAPEVMVKVVVTPASRDEEIFELADRVAAIDPRITVVLQPVTPFGAVREAPSAARMLALAARIGRGLADVRVIPQTHKLYGAP